MMIEVSNGEVVDRASVLTIKGERLKLGPSEKAAIERELDVLVSSMRIFGVGTSDSVFLRLLGVNAAIWDAVDRQQEILKYGDYSAPGFAEASAQVVRLNMQRYKLKKSVDEMTESAVREFKQE
jgi:hypothetical protein